MPKYNNLYCKLFIDTDKDKSQLLRLVCNIVSGSISRASTIVTRLCELDIEDNEDYNAYKKNQYDDGFLYFRYYFDIEPNNLIDEKMYISSVAQLLQSLWHLGFNAVCACEFEEELPMMGGYNPNRK